ncbi:MAG TPA: thiopeptide-type bacteriocin biosynthesis protein [Thermoanaerobaculia bacterium]
MREACWSSYHLFRGEPWEVFLTGAVEPFVAAARDEGLIESFFFIRYWERGPHIRLRLRTASAEELDARVRSYFADFFARSPSARSISHETWLPNDSVQNIAYEPETGRYGGPRRLPIAEEQFEASSRAVLAIVGEGEWSYERALGAAIQLHLMFAHAFAFDLTAVKQFFGDTADVFLRFENQFVRLDEPAESILPVFALAFGQQQEQLARVHAAVWSALEEGAEIEQAWATRWLADMRAVATRLRDTTSAEKTAPEHAILRSYIHMTNNRLGIRNRDEAYLAYIMRRSLEKIDALIC